ncbi:hypothetical protein NP493_28g00002 [Ridgeia piscesae]|uniref:Uncharacterized protein n=1 Tax=Ridgeia piscesae TaxID=27915 RepID=A0AAD9PDA9_RIDPI|nr:hypothetical protein NP493_28g00002 [Ridgeia piscesae]
MCRETHRCIDVRHVCDGRNDCFDSQIGHDEMYCDATASEPCLGLRCGQMCVGEGALCDGITDCLDRTDEANCTCKSNTMCALRHNSTTSLRRHEALA